MVWRSFKDKLTARNYNYAGIFSGTDLGAPITDRAGTTAIWYGSFNHTLNPSKDFALTVTFNKIGGTLDAFVRAGIANNSFIFDDVRFDTRGLITGEVLYVTFLPNDRTATPITQTATLRGLIGQQGAVGVFVGEEGSNIGGGFVAHPTAKLDSNKINFADWGGVDGDPKTTVINKDNTGTDPLLYGVASVVNDGPQGTLFTDWQQWMVKVLISWGLLLHLQLLLAMFYIWARIESVAQPLAVLVANTMLGYCPPQIWVCRLLPKTSA